MSEFATEAVIRSYANRSTEEVHDLAFIHSLLIRSEKKQPCYSGWLVTYEVVGVEARCAFVPCGDTVGNVLWDHPLERPSY